MSEINLEIPGLKDKLVFDTTGELIKVKNKRRKKIVKTYSEKEVKNMLIQQKRLCAIIPQLSRGSKLREDWRQWRKFIDDMSKTIKGLPLTINYLSK